MITRRDLLAAMLFLDELIHDRTNPHRPKDTIEMIHDSYRQVDLNTDPGYQEHYCEGCEESYFYYKKKKSKCPVCGCADIQVSPLAIYDIEKGEEK